MISSPRKRKLSSMLSPESSFLIHTPKKVKEIENDTHHLRRSPRLMSNVPELETSPSIKAYKAVCPPSPRTPKGKENLTTSPHLLYLSRRNVDKGSPRIHTEHFYQRKTQYLDPLQRKALGIRKALISDLKNVPQIKRLKSTNLKHRPTQKHKIRKLGSNNKNDLVMHKQKYQRSILNSVLTKPVKNQIRNILENENDVLIRSSPRKASTAPECVSPVTPTMARKFFTSRSPKSDSKRWSTTTRGGVFHIKFKAASTTQLKNKSKPKKTIPLDIRVVKSKHSVTTFTRKVSPKQNILSVNENQTKSKPVSDQLISPVVVLSQKDQDLCKISLESSFRMDKPCITTNLKSQKKEETVPAGENQACFPDQPSENLGSSPKKCYPIFTRAFSSKTMNSTDKVVTKSPAARTASPRIKPPVRYGAKSDKKEQLIIDAGQWKLGANQCHTCNMVYMIGEPQDEKCHSKYHHMFVSSLKFPGWKKERVLGEFIDGRVIMVLPTDSSFMVKRVEEVRKFVDRDLGFPDIGLPNKTNSAFFLFITVDKKVAGCVVAESITQAYRVITEDKDHKNADSNSLLKTCPQPPQQPWCCSTKPERALCGVSRVWVAPSCRRRRIASRLLDCLRCNFYYGHALSVNEIAFSDPTPAGKEFAAKYTGTSEFLVYK